MLPSHSFRRIVSSVETGVSAAVCERCMMIRNLINQNGNLIGGFETNRRANRIDDVRRVWILVLDVVCIIGF